MDDGINSGLRDGRHVRKPTSWAQNHMRSDSFPLVDMWSKSCRAVRALTPGSFIPLFCNSKIQSEPRYHELTGTLFNNMPSSLRWWRQSIRRIIWSPWPGYKFPPRGHLSRSIAQAEHENNWLISCSPGYCAQIRFFYHPHGPCK